MANPPQHRITILKIAIPVPVDRLFDYLPPENIDVDQLKAGVRVIAPFGNRKKIGFLIEQVHNSDIDIKRLKPVLEILDPSPLLSKKDIQLLEWASRYYHYPLAEVFNAAFPASLRKGKKASFKSENFYQLTAKGECLTAEQLKKTPKQQQIFRLLQTHPQGISATTLNKYDKNWRAAVKSLLTKDIISCSLKIKTDMPISSSTEAALEANEEQAQAISQLSEKLGGFSVSLLEGITGSGKTEVYMQVIQQVLDRGLQVMVLLPEITLTPQLENRFIRRFAVPLSVSHSKLTETQRHHSWLAMQQGHSAILLGTRSALFTPLKKPGLIILDEEHDSSFKQQEGFRFSARDLAIVKAKLLHIPIILGTATPSLESLHNIQNKGYHLLRLSERAGSAIKPRFLLFDIRNKQLHDGLSEPLINQIRKTLAKKEQVLLFLNRRGYAPVLICHSCAWVARCHQCDSSLVIHHDEKILRCHHCGHQQTLITQCPACRSVELKPIGLGTERVEKSLHQLFPEQKIVRLDRDSTQRKGILEQHLEQINRGEIDIILGTQMLAKGHHFPNVTLVSLLDVDSGLFSIDFHATEKLAQLIVQVAGRAGRAEKPGTVILQTRQPEHPLLTVLLKQGYNRFAEMALQERQEAHLPPYSSQALLRAYAADPTHPQLFLQAVCQLIQTFNDKHTCILGPVPAPMARRSGYHHFQLLLQNPQRGALQSLLDKLTPQLYQLKQGKKVRWSLDVDPVDLY